MHDLYMDQHHISQQQTQQVLISTPVLITYTVKAFMFVGNLFHVFPKQDIFVGNYILGIQNSYTVKLLETYICRPMNLRLSCHQEIHKNQCPTSYNDFTVYPFKGTLSGKSDYCKDTEKIKQTQTQTQRSLQSKPILEF